MFQCMDPTCGEYFGWSAKKILYDYIVKEVGDKKELVLMKQIEYQVCPHCGSLTYEELPRDYKAPKKEVPPVEMPKSATLFDPSDLVLHSWKGKKTGPREYAPANDRYGWDFVDQFKPATIDFLKTCPDHKHLVDKYNFTLKGKIVQMQKVNQK